MDSGSLTGIVQVKNIMNLTPQKEQIYTYL